MGSVTANRSRVMDVYSVISSPEFGATMRGMSFIGLFLGLAFVIVAFS